MIKWKDEYSVNVNDIDEQHKKLFEIGGRIYEIASLNDNADYYDEIVEILDELTDYTLFHFDFEENLLNKYDYNELESQKFEHMFFVKKLKKLASKDIDKEQDQAVTDIAGFVIDWITGHILKRDMKYKQFLNDKGVR